MNTISKYYHTIKYLKFRQIVFRLIDPVRRKLNLLTIKNNVDFKSTGKIGRRFPYLAYDVVNTQEKIKSGRFKFLNREVNIGYPIRWSNINESTLWLFNLHYMHYLKNCDSQTATKICQDWIDHHKTLKGNAWHPYVCSLRIVNWCKFNLNDEKVNRSIYLQASWLFRNIEYEVGGNHLLENARALIFAGQYFGRKGDADQWFTFGMKLLGKELKKQIFPDGGHYERSMMYHNIILLGLLEILNILSQDDENYNGLESTCKIMLDFLYSTSHESKEIPLFNDSAFKINPSAEKVLEFGKKFINNAPSFNDSFVESGYYIVRDQGIHFIIDGGEIGPDSLPAHAHGDIFSYELSIDGEKFITDTGVYDYDDSEEREYSRSTSAHNTVTIDNKSQAEFWGCFRVARRYAPSNVSFTKQNKKVQFYGEYNGYSHLIGDKLLHQRRVDIDFANKSILFEDLIKGNNKHVVKSFIHIHPDIQIQEEDNTYILKGKKRVVKIVVNSQAHFITHTEYYPEFGKKVAKKTIVLSTDGELPAKLTYQILYN